MASLTANQPRVLLRKKSLLIALLVAIVVHVLLLLDLDLGLTSPKHVNKSIDVVLVTKPAKKTPKKAHALAAQNQEGGGQTRTKPELPKLKIPTEAALPKKPVVQAPQPEVKPQAAPKILTQKQAPHKPVQTAEVVAPPVKEQPQPTPLLTPEDLEMQIAQLGAEIAKRKQNEEDTRIKSVNAISAHQYVAAQYISDWEAKVERTGNINYPELARKKGFSGRLTLDVGINADGSIFSMRISKSSGYEELDAAAKQIVQMSAPFPPLPKALLNEVDVLVIKRVWSFSDEGGLSAN